MVSPISGASSSASLNRLAAMDRADDGADAGLSTQSSLDRLLNRVSPLDRLVADAGPLGKFRTDAPDALPSGTSSFTSRINDTINRLAARLGIPAERVLTGNPTRTPELAPQQPTELPPGANAAAPDTRIADPRPAVATDADNRTARTIAGNPTPA
ncbi:hypothetical protein [Sphingomonas crocodyli]|uniref:Uncharacterized protein n=1 Tax=Sphingomonas crocodyli TaxID=1979270 RepID=A0A437M6G0_9SPHN|nr:hypothetical protein [Sphingomonas crocodyli]RVT93298.1 hypothetical protein EOD43_05275 [Sphingomonas crocodyli]